MESELDMVIALNNLEASREEAKMSDELENKIKKIFYPDEYGDKEQKMIKALYALISTSSLSQPSRVVAVRKCQSQHGPDGMIDTGGQNPDGSWISIPCDCHGTGEIVRELTNHEVVEWAKQVALAYKASNPTLSSVILLPSGERVRVKEEI